MLDTGLVLPIGWFWTVEVELPVECDATEAPVFWEGSHPPSGKVAEAGVFNGAEVAVPFRISKVCKKDENLSVC